MHPRNSAYATTGVRCLGETPCMAELNVVTGAFGFTGSCIARRLLDRGCAVRPLTGHAHRASPLHDLVDIRPLQFADERRLASDLAGARVLYNTYWVRFPYHGVT